MAASRAILNAYAIEPIRSRELSETFEKNVRGEFTYVSMRASWCVGSNFHHVAILTCDATPDYSSIVICFARSRGTQRQRAFPRAPSIVVGAIRQSCVALDSIRQMKSQEAIGTRTRSLPGPRSESRRRRLRARVATVNKGRGGWVFRLLGFAVRGRPEIVKDNRVIE